MAERLRECASLLLWVDPSSDRRSALEELRAFFVAARPQEFAEVWIHCGQFPALGVLVHQQSAWLTYVRYEGDLGFSSRSVAYSGAPDVMLEFMLSNGQVDKYPASWTYPTDVVLDAVFAFVREGRVPDTIAWFNDSGDGAAGPNEPFDAPCC